jgi:hypothetical protein
MKTTTLEREQEEQRQQSASAPKQELDRGQVETLAYHYWCARGCPPGSPEEDWYRAEDDLRKTAGREEAAREERPKESRAA